MNGQRCSLITWGTANGTAGDLYAAQVTVMRITVTL